MEFLPGGELYNLIERNGKLSEDKARVYFQQILAGLEYIHQQGYTHRDLKPENILLDKDGNIKVGDFGLCNILPLGDFLKTSCGSPNYAAPEVISGKKYCGSEVDVWSLGVVLFSLVAGHLPFDESAIPTLFAKIKSGKYDMPYFFSENLKDLIRRIFTVDPLARITCNQIWKHPWNNVGIPYTIPCSRMMKELYKREINIKALKDTLSYPEFAHINIEKDILDVLYNKAPDRYGIKPIYTIFVDISLSIKRKEINHFPIKKGIFQRFDYENFILEGTTKASSSMEIDSDSQIPSNWVFGFRCTLQAYFFTVKLLEGFTKAGLSWKRISSFRMSAKNQKIKLEVGIFKYEDALVVDCMVKKGKLMDMLDILHTVYVYIYKNIHY